MKLDWFYNKGIWISGPFTIAIEHCPRMKLTYFELFDGGTRFVKSFASVQEAQQHAEAMQHVAMRVAS